MSSITVAEAIHEKGRPTEVEENSTKSSLLASVYDGVFFSIMFGLGEAYLSAFGVYLGASALQIGILASLPLFVGALTQLLGVHLIESGRSRRKILVIGASMQASMWIFIGLLPWIMGAGVSTAGILIVLVIAYFAAGHLLIPVWNSLMGDIVPAPVRGRYFGRRNQISGSALLVCVISGGALLEYSRANHYELYAFTALFAISCVARLISARWLSKHADPELEFSEEDRFTFLQFLKRLPKSNFAKYALFHATMHFCVFVAGPYFTLYMLRELGLSYLEYTYVIAAGMGANFLLMQFWGKHSDRFGNVFVLRICSVGVAIVPMLWAFSSSIAYLIVIQIVSGFFWAGFQLGSSNFLLDAVSPPKRGRCTAYLWVLTATAIVIGSSLGGQLLQWRSGLFLQSVTFNSFSSNYIALFVLSGMLRGVVLAIFLGRFHEVREVETLHRRIPTYRIPQIHPVIGGGVRMAFNAGRVRNRKKRKVRNAEPSVSHEGLDNFNSNQ